MLWDKKGRPAIPSDDRKAETPPPTPAATPKWDNPMPDIAVSRTANPPIPTNPNHSTVLGGSLVVKGELSGQEDLLIEGQFEGTVDLPDNALTVGAQGKVKAEIHARQVIVLGTVEGKITAKDKIDLRKTANIIGDLSSASFAIEDGAYVKGSVESIRETREVGQEKPRSQSHKTALPSVV